MSVDATLLVIAPEMMAVDETRRLAVIDLAAKSVGPAYGDNRELATAYLAAHMLTTSGRGGNTGSVKSIREGDLSITYGGGEGTGYQSTAYGIEYVRLTGLIGFAARTRMM
ncbi:DUF4054 domain-containing protein [Rufibacter sediminis]|uniref:DUF4054 domain-containing protein n=1 Tax=Rufibacter sediminis TaxID=2762756 RepID=A0ABR6VUS5_9BACT|nr:DUF4054 domain-containing protein [Rufibacter sediminis]MBC3540654.1 DUF4054 domain-containing protein [Rufibacter sediminis]